VLSDFLARHLPPGERLWLGLSGGRDSASLLNACHEALPGRLSAIHIHHGLSPHADEWADFCRCRCLALGVPLRLEKIAVEQNGKGTEAAARTARHRVFQNILAGEGGKFLALAHHRRDQAETLLFRLLRGAGVKGAAAMRPVQAQAGFTLLRPWLDVPAEAIAAYAQENSLEWIEDESNADTRYRRNFLRHEILPRLAARFPGAETTLARAAGHFAEAQSLLDALAEIDSAADIPSLPPARQANWLRWKLAQDGQLMPDAKRLAEMLDALHPHP
jgi:tRNA(Ile)-lysidine synthase